MSYVIFDVLRRYLEYLGHEVTHVQNFTDVDDKIIQRAEQGGIYPQELAERNIQEFMESMDAINVKKAQVYPRATQEIPHMIKVIDALVEKGYAYESDGDVYFQVTKVEDYGKLSNRTLDGMIAGARIEVGTNKHHPMDFALWKAAKVGEPSWESPWGPGRPGWHIECTAMSMVYLGETVDIHGGGQDLIFPHHENETAQSEAYTGAAPFARYWVHNGLLHMGEDKMSKSLGNLISLQEALKQHNSDALRIFFLSSHYRSPLTYSDDGIVSTERAAERLRNALREGVGDSTDELDPQAFRLRFLQAMDFDMNTPHGPCSSLRPITGDQQGQGVRPGCCTGSGHVEGAGRHFGPDLQPAPQAPISRDRALYRTPNKDTSRTSGSQAICSGGRNTRPFDGPGGRVGRYPRRHHLDPPLAVRSSLVTVLGSKKLQCNPIMECTLLGLPASRPRVIS